MQIPAKIEFMSQEWVIRAAGPRELNNDLGSCDPTTNTILLDPHLPPSVLLQTLMHELVHVIEMTMNLCFTEQQTDGMAAGLLHLIRTNPDIISIYYDGAEDVAELDQE